MGDKMSNTRKIKIYFTIIMAFFILTLVGGEYYYNQYGFSTNGIIYEFMKTPSANMYENYSLSIPQDSIIIRLDDAGAWHYDNLVPKIANDVTSRNLSMIIAVIPDKISNDAVFLTYMRELLKNPRIEIAQHGYTHSEEEFKNASLEQAREWIQEGKEDIITQLKVVPITFIPPYNVYSSDTVTALKEADFKVIAGEDGDYNISKDILILGYTAATYNFSTNRTISADKIIQDCKESLKEMGYCEIMVHPQDFLEEKSEEGPRQLDLVKYTEFLRLLDELKKLDGQSITFKDNLVYNGL
jgi:hypothetical protein